MLAAEHRLRSGQDFLRITRSGHSARHPRLVVYAVSGQASCSRAGLIVSKSVGNSVVRHRVSRRLRAALAPRLTDMTFPMDVVVRALPAAGRATSADLVADLDAAFLQLGFT